MAEETALKTYRGNCHCAAFVYEVELPEIKGYTECNCSICHKKGYAWLGPMEEGLLRFVKGSKDELAVYTFGSGSLSHRFCAHCGTAVLGDHAKMKPGLLLNARTIQDLDIWSLNVSTFDGKALPPPREPPVYSGPEPTATVENGKIYHGSCHCGAVKVALKLKPLETYDLSNDDEQIVDCNCSICTRGAYIWIYPHKDQSVVQGREHLSYRIFGYGIERKAFCKHCGVHICNEPSELTDEEYERLDDYGKEERSRVINNRNFTLRILDDFDCSTLKTQRLDGWNDMPGAYVNP
ncbi:hypothetical protein M406DRAFT_345618 [Cryphonectria parasitica EP155]|uniref:CENP-V/GFA domain-containing protein n=1 Tax=Cryphonectria parasitica (strain ATCC 38755 / EP155) TaxID=660469 RepID=A0A9P4Y7B6_CRYP1|nr:uncharacterized protein M406DRAFT_345618 [Cryphonectria parasitica EP155]KAF3767774.1 hypothetical protein M406DRAFT_345618 [Cryphonectria parasitica EP155]